VEDGNGSWPDCAVLTVLFLGVLDHVHICGRAGAAECEGAPMAWAIAVPRRRHDGSLAVAYFPSREMCYKRAT
jgi:hypothetical protein